MCNGWNHSQGCECGFGPPYDRDVAGYFDKHVGSGGGERLSSAGPNCQLLSSHLQDEQLATRVVSTFLWQSYIGLRDVEGIGRSTNARNVEKRPEIYIVRHAGASRSGFPRHDLLILDPQFPRGKVEQGYVDVTEADLRSGWRNFRKAYSISESSAPPWLSRIDLQEIPGIAREAMSAQRHFFIAMHPPRVVWTSVAASTLTKVASPAIAIKDKNGREFATAGIIATDHDGRVGVTTALHSVDENGPKILVAGVPGRIAAQDIITDSCFITFTPPELPDCAPCNGPLIGVTPGRNESVWFDGIASGKTATYVDGWTIELPWITPGVQSRIITPPVTESGDSGAALMNQQGKVVGFAFYRTGFASRAAFSAWIWAESVFSALHLQ